MENSQFPLFPRVKTMGTTGNFIHFFAVSVWRFLNTISSRSLGISKSFLTRLISLWKEVIEFFLNVFTEFSDKNNIILKRLLGSNPCPPVRETLPLSHMDKITEKIVKLILIHASVDSLNSLNSLNSAPFRKNPNIFVWNEFIRPETTLRNQTILSLNCLWTDWGISRSEN